MSTNREKIEAQRMAVQSTDCAHLQHLIGPEELEQLMWKSRLQNISTAPRDDRWVVLAAVDGTENSITFAPAIFRHDRWIFPHGQELDIPTHWMPLPELSDE